MAKDLTNSRIDRQNILNNEIAIEEIQSKSGTNGILWEGKFYYQITVENLRKGEYSKSSFDEYELLLIEEFLEIT